MDFFGVKLLALILHFTSIVFLLFSPTGGTYDPGAVVDFFYFRSMIPG